MLKANALKFSLHLLHPRYWLWWGALGLLFILVQLPYPLIRAIGLKLGRLSMHIAQRRVKITQRNLELCFPEHSVAQRQQWLIECFESAGMGLMECGMAWFWPDQRIKKWCTMTGQGHITHAQKIQRGVLLIGIHFFSLELGARAFGIHYPGIGVYRPHNNALMEWIQCKGRLRSNKLLIQRKQLKSMLTYLKKGEILWYAPDHDYGARTSVFVPFFAVEKAATTVGTHFLVSKADPEIITLTPIRHADGSGYTLSLQAPLKNFPRYDPIAAAQCMNQALEQQILRAPGQYMWLHRRFKTRPDGEPSLY